MVLPIMAIVSGIYVTNQIVETIGGPLEVAAKKTSDVFQKMKDKIEEIWTTRERKVEKERRERYHRLSEEIREKYHL